MNKYAAILLSFLIGFIMCATVTLINTPKDKEGNLFKEGWNHGFFTVVVLYETNTPLQPEVLKQAFEQDSINYFKTN